MGEAKRRSLRLGDAPIEAQYRERMKALATAIDTVLNSNATPAKRTGFALLVFPFEGHEGRCNYISNAAREDMIVLLKEQLARFEIQPHIEGRA